MLHTKRLLTAVAALLFMAGCATHTGHAPAPEQGTSATSSTSEQPRPKEDEDKNRPSTHHKSEEAKADKPPKKAPPHSASEISSSAVMSLLDNADDLIKADKPDAAASTLERALNLDPRNPFIYQRLAALYLSQDKHDQAEQMARKSNSVAGDNPFVKSDNWKLIAEARRQNHDDRGARKASTQAVNYRHAAEQFRQ